MGEGRPDPVRRRLWLTLTVLLLALLAVGVTIALLGGGDVSYESPRYRVVETIGNDVEIREYEPYLVAETVVDGSLEGAGSQGFRILAKFIFGDNRQSEKIAMTAPVTQAPSETTKIAMTAPVTQQRSGDQYAIQFMMPSEYDRESLPTPNDPRIRIREVEERTLAAIRYSGRWSEKRYETHLDTLLQTLADAGYQPVGEPQWARYDPPFKPWFMRRNEILVAFRPSNG